MKRLALAALACLCLDALGQGVRFRLEVDAPREFASTLRRGLTLARWQQDPNLTAEQLRRLTEQAARETREAAATEGYFSPQVEVTISETESPWRVTVKLDPGARTHVSHVELRFSGPAVQDDEARGSLNRVREAWRLRPGEPFRQADWDAAKREAARELARWRYAGARVADSRATIDPEKREALLEVELASGPAFRFGPVRVTGLKRYADSVAENLSPIREGATYDRDQVLGYQRRLLETGYFASVQADIDTHPLLADAAPLRVAIIEAASQNVEAGVGYSTDAGARGELRYSNRDVFDSGWRFRTALRLDEKTQELQADFDSPPRRGGAWNGVFTRLKQADIQNETTREFALGASHNLYDALSPIAYIVSGHFEEQRVGGDVTDNRWAIYFGYRRSFRHTDDLILPRAGYLGTAEVGGAPPGLATREFLRILAGASLLLPISRTGDLLVRGQAGSVVAKTREGIPTTFLFRTGGDQTVRGYAYESLGVRQGDAIVGGRRLAWGSVEYTHWVGEGWGVGTFVDAGNAWDQGLEFDPAVGYGVGARLRTPIGPIRADLAYGHKTSEWRLHFSVGYTF